MTTADDEEVFLDAYAATIASSIDEAAVCSGHYTALEARDVPPLWHRCEELGLECRPVSWLVDALGYTHGEIYTLQHKRVFVGPVWEAHLWLDKIERQKENK